MVGVLHGQTYPSGRTVFACAQRSGPHFFSLRLKPLLFSCLLVVSISPPSAYVFLLDRLF